MVTYNPSQPLDPSDGGNLVGHSQTVIFGPGTSLPRQFVYYHFPDESAYNISPPGHGNTLALKGAAVNLTEPAWVPGDDTQQTAPFTFVPRRQDHVLFTAESTVQFAPNSEGEEAGMSVFLNRAQHFDFGVVGLNNGRGKLRRYVRLLTVTLNSTNAGAEDPVSKPGMVMLPSTFPANTPIRLRVKAESSSTYSFSFGIMGDAHISSSGSGNTTEWTTVGFGDATQVSGGFTGVSGCSLRKAFTSLNERPWLECMRLEMANHLQAKLILAISSILLKRKGT
jgi:beta-xylosidase